MTITPLLGGGIRGTEKATMPMIIPCVGVCVFRMIWSMTYMPVPPGIQAVAACYTVAWAITSIFYLLLSVRRLDAQED